MIPVAPVSSPRPLGFVKLVDSRPLTIAWLSRQHWPFDTLAHRVGIQVCRNNAMASARSLSGLMKWLSRDEWHDQFADVFDRHLQPACEASGVEPEQVVSIL